MKKLVAALTVSLAFGCGEGPTGPTDAAPEARLDVVPTVTEVTTDVQWFVVFEIGNSNWGPDVQPGDRVLGTISFTAGGDIDPLECSAQHAPFTDTRIEFPELGVDDATPGLSGVSVIQLETCYQEQLTAWVYAGLSVVHTQLVGAGLLGGVAELQTPDLSGTVTHNSFGLGSGERWATGRLTAISPTPLRTKGDCMSGGWELHGFVNQGQCIRFIETGMDSR